MMISPFLCAPWLDSRGVAKVRQAIAQWSIWRQPLVVVALVFIVELAAIAGPLYESAPVRPGDIRTAALLASLSIAYSTLTRRFERARRALGRSTLPRTIPNLMAAWCLTAAVLLPLSLAAIVLIVVAVAEWPSRNIVGHATPYRYVYSTAGAILAAMGTQLALTLELPRQVSLLVAAATYTIICVLVISLAVASSGQVRALGVYLQPKSYQLDGWTTAIALAQVELYDIHLWSLAWLSLPATIAVQRRATKAYLQAAAVESGNQPMREDAWHIAATEIVAALPVVSILRVTTDDPLTVHAVAQMQAGCDAVGQVGESGLAILLVDCPELNAEALAGRLRAALRYGGVSASVAVAVKPRDGDSLHDLWIAAEAELITREAARRSATSPDPDA
jgi:hypothetical protein